MTLNEFLGWEALLKLIILVLVLGFSFDTMFKGD